MKKKLLYFSALLVMTWAFTRCEAPGTCKICHQVTYDGTTITQEDPEAQYCGADLTAIENAHDIVNGSTRVTWVCR
jgi:hypothetical protein